MSIDAMTRAALARRIAAIRQTRRMRQAGNRAWTCISAVPPIATPAEPLFIATHPNR